VKAAQVLVPAGFAGGCEGAPPCRPVQVYYELSGDCSVWVGFSVRHPGLNHPDPGRPAGADYSFLVLQPCPHPLHRRRRPQSANAVSI